MSWVGFGLWSVLSVGWAQEAAEPSLEFQGRVEIEVSSKREDWVVEPIGEDGLILIGGDKAGREWTFSRYDANFEPQWSIDWDASDKHTLLERYDTEHALWALFRARSGDLKLVGVGIEDGEQAVFALDVPRKARWAKELIIDGEQAYTLALRRPSTYAGEGWLMRIDLRTGSSSVLPVAETAGEREVSFQRLAADGDTVHLVGITQQRGRHTLHLMTVDGEQLTLHQQLQDSTGERNLLTAQRVPTQQGDLVIGTYAQRKKGDAAQGMYVVGYQGDQVAFERYHSFSTFSNFFDYLPERRQERLERRQERREESGGDLSLSYQLNVHDVIEKDDRYLMVADAYHAEYQTQTRTVTVTQNGQTTTQTEYYQVFVGYRFTHAVVAAFSRSGELLWDASFPIKNVLTPRVEDRVQVHDDGDQLAMVYAWGGKLYTRIATPDGIAEDKTEQEEDGVQRGWASDVEHWYDDQFLMWGFQKVKEDGDKRKVFAFARVAPAD